MDGKIFERWVSLYVVRTALAAFQILVDPYSELTVDPFVSRPSSVL